MAKNPIALTHHFLVAMPTLSDYNFSQAVIYLYEHTPEGALGMIINKPLHINLGNVLEHLDINYAKKEDLSQKPVLMGGPVGQEHGFIIFEKHLQLTKKDSEIFISASKDMLREIADGKGPSNFLITLGYAGWNAGQLEKEIARNDWLIVPFNHDVLFKMPLENRWKGAAASIGIDIHSLSNQVGHA